MNENEKCNCEIYEFCEKCRPTWAIAERVHHPYSPSTLQSLEACPCYEGKQSAKPHPRTIIGTIAHGVVETGEDNAQLDDDDMSHAADCIDFYERQRTLMEQRGAGITELKETYLSVDDLEFPDGAKATSAGFIDCAIISHDQIYAEIMDWKFGLWEVEKADNNLQGIAYALGLFRAYPKLSQIKFWFKQPVIGNVTSHVFTRESIPELYLRVQVVVARAREARAKKDFSTARPMIPACNFCKHIGICPRVTEFACHVGAKFYPLDIPASITPNEVHSPHDTQLGLRLASVLEVWAKSYKGTITDRVLRGDAKTPDGFTLQSRTPREIIDPKKYKEVALRYLTSEEYETTLKASFGAVEDLIKDKAPRGQKSAQVDEFGAALVDIGAVEFGQAYTFLRAATKKDK